MLENIGGARRDRTADLYNAIVALSQLSYSPSTILILKIIDQIYRFAMVEGVALSMKMAIVTCRERFEEALDNTYTMSG